jgi:hypothetical protein
LKVRFSTIGKTIMFTKRFTRSLVKATLPFLAVGSLFAADGPVPVGKYVIEAKPKALVAASTPVDEKTNPSVEPGKVKWHATLAIAQAAAKKSAKPILLFQMMGHLDKQFC